MADLHDTQAEDGMPEIAVTMSPVQMNEVILEKLDLLAPRLDSLLGNMNQLSYDLSNGMVRWDKILERAKREC